MDQFTNANADRDRWFARYGDDYDNPTVADRAYLDCLAERDLARSIMGAADEAPECDRHVPSPEHAEQLSGANMTATLETTEVHPAWCEGKGCYELANAALHSSGCTTSGRSAAEVTQEVQWETGVLRSLPLRVEARFAGDSIGEPMTAEDCRELAAVLLAAVERLESINARVTA